MGAVWKKRQPVGEHGVAIQRLEKEYVVGDSCDIMACREEGTWKMVVRQVCAWRRSLLLVALSFPAVLSPSDTSLSELE